MTLFAETLSRHSKIALQLSGGKDSLAVLYLLRDWWARLAVYWCNTGDALPATAEMMRGIREMVPNFKEVQGRQPETLAQFGWPSDVVPQGHTVLGNAVFGKTDFLVQERIHCCWKSLMLPMHEAMLADGITLAIRGKRHDEADKTGILSGDTSAGYEVLFPIYDWTAADVVRYLAEIHVDLPEVYQYLDNSIDCATCSAWWEHHHEKYLSARLPEAEKVRAERVIRIRTAVTQTLLGV